MDVNTLPAHSDKYREYLSAWIAGTINNKSWERYDDLHLDQIDAEFKDRGIWVEAGIFLYRLMLPLIEAPYQCLLAIPLAYADSVTDPDSLTWDSLTSQLDVTPPSFYLFPGGSTNLKRTLEDSVPAKIIRDSIGCPAFFKQDREGSGYYRRIYITNT